MLNNTIMSTSGLTIRRDIQMLDEKRLVMRTHRGCIAAARAAVETAYLAARCPLTRTDFRLR
jgi:DeoR/GlpR family transcriptional regulator of sugar metabolism